MESLSFASEIIYVFAKPEKNFRAWFFTSGRLSEEPYLLDYV